MHFFLVVLSSYNFVFWSNIKSEMEYPFCCVDSVFLSQTRMLLMKTRTEKELLFEEENYPLNDQSNVDD